jgi:hypothetical protein
MPKSRGQYKRYIYDPTSLIPDRTRYDYLNQFKAQSVSNLNENEFVMSFRPSINTINTINAINNNEYISANNESISTNIEQNSFNNEPQIVINEEHLVIENNDVTSNNQSFDVDLDLNFNELETNSTLNGIQSISNIAINREELAAAFLACFYSGTTTQTSLKDYLELSNIYSDIKLPTSFDGLSNILFENKKNFIRKKLWYCGVCLKTYTREQIDRTVRSCLTCKTR